MSTPLQADAIEQFQARFGKTPGSQDQETERRHWQQICADLLKERAEMQEQMSKLQEERDNYLRAVLALTRADADVLNFTKEEVFAQIGKGPSWEALLAEIAQYPEK